MSFVKDGWNFGKIACIACTLIPRPFSIDYGTGVQIPLCTGDDASDGPAPTLAASHTTRWFEEVQRHLFAPTVSEGLHPSPNALLTHQDSGPRHGSSLPGFE